MAFFRSVFTIMAKDLRAELRTKEAINASLAFALVILLMFSFAFDQEETPPEIFGGLLWIVFAFAGTLLLNRSFARELPNDCLDALISAPVPAAALLRGEALANFVMVLATWGSTLTGATFSALTVNIRLREVMLPILNFPILIPALLGAMRLTSV